MPSAAFQSAYDNAKNLKNASQEDMLEVQHLPPYLPPTLPQPCFYPRALSLGWKEQGAGTRCGADG